MCCVILFVLVLYGKVKVGVMFNIFSINNSCRNSVCFLILIRIDCNLIILLRFVMFMRNMWGLCLFLKLKFLK